MKQNISVLTLALIGATAGYPQVTLNTTPSRSVGTPIPGSNTVEGSNPNLVEGKELYNPWSVALDTSVSPPILYVSDTGNNRVLGWKNALNFTNGQAADLVIGQQDFYATDPQGPAYKFSIELWAPSGLAVSSTGDLYVADTNNNRVLRFRTPFQHVAGTPGALTTAPDLFIGQPTLTSRAANFTGLVNPQGLSFPANMAFDGNGNLWICDTANYRVLGFKASTLNATGGSISADIVIGQPNMSTNTGLSAGAGALQTTNQFAALGGIGVDPQGRLYVGDNLGGSAGLGRILVFAHPTAVTSNASADRLMGVFPPNTPTPTPTTQGATYFNVPQGIFFFPDTSDSGGDCGSAAGCAYVGVMDTRLNRATIFPPYSIWPALPNPPQAVQPGGVIGQALNFTTVGPNGTTSTTMTTPPASPNVLFGSIGAVYLNSSKELFIADTNNNRVIVMPRQTQPGNPAFFGDATRVLGQFGFDQFSVNYIEGKEFNFSAGAGMALDTNGATPHLYVADPMNHRILGFKDARLIAPNLHADLVIGQPDFGTALCNYPSGDSSKPTQSSLCYPVGLAVDPQGNLYVADYGNGRVLRFPAPFSYTGTGPEQADLVLGQQDFVTQDLDPTQSTMHEPYGLAFSGTNGLLVSDVFHNRVLYFPFSAGGTFAAGTDNGKLATKVYGQQDFSGESSGNSSSQLNAPHHIAADTSGRLYVADTVNNRILIFDDPNSPFTPTGGDSAPLALTGLNVPLGVYVSPIDGTVWVANSYQGAVVRYPAFDTLILNQASLTTISDFADDPGIKAPNGIPAPNTAQFAPLATVQDQFGDLFVADNGNRIITYYQNLSVVNGASFLANRLLAPDTVASIFPAQNGSPQFGSNTAQFSTVPVPTTLGDVQVTVNGTQASIFYTSPSQINFVIPSNAPTSGTAEVDVIQASTGQVLGAGLMSMATTSPGIFQCPSSHAALRQACAFNEDGSQNSFTNPALRGHLIQIFGTGQGVIPNSPPDGTPAPTSPLYPSQFSPGVILNNIFTYAYPVAPGDPSDRSFVKYFGLAPGLLGFWQLNLQIPMGVVPGNTTSLEVQINNVTDTDKTSVDPTTGTVWHMSIAVK